MGNEDITAVLLPQSGIDFFLTNNESYKLAAKLKGDWRFARVSVDAMISGIDGAVERYAENVSPELIIVETDNIGEDFISKLEQLSGVCSEKTDAIVIGPKNDVQLYRSLVEMGIKDYLVRPIDENELVKAIAKSLIEKKGLTGSKLVTVIGSKGGIGATSVAQMLAYDMSENLDYKTMLMDAAGSVSSLGIAFGVEAGSSLTEAVRVAKEGSEDDLQRICQKVNEKLSLLVCGGESILSDIPEPDKVEGLVNRLMKKFPVVLVDLSYTSRAVQKRLLERSSSIVVVSSPTISSLRSARMLLGEIRKIRSSLKEVDLIINMQGMDTTDEIPVQDIKTALDFEPAVTIAYQPRVFTASETTGVPVGKGKEDARIIEKIRVISERIVTPKNKGDLSKNKQDGESFLGKLKSFLKG